MRRLAGAAVGIALAAGIAAVGYTIVMSWWAFRALGNRDDDHRQLLDAEVQTWW